MRLIIKEKTNWKLLFVLIILAIALSGGILFYQNKSYIQFQDLKKQHKIIQPTSTEIMTKNFELLGVSETFTFGEILDIAKNVGGIAEIRPAFLLAVFQEELNLEKFDLCYVTNFNTGDGVKAIDGKILSKVMHPKRDIPDFLNITLELGRDPLKTLVTCPMSFGWGGAMGPADFIPSTWMRYKDKIEKIIGKPADPWDVQDAFLAAGLYLSDSGAKTKTRDGEWNAAMIYFSSSTNPTYSWYADDVIAIADKIQVDIEIVDKIVK